MTPASKPTTLKLEDGKVYTLALLYTTGRQSQFNQTQTLFTLTSGDRLIVPYTTAKQIEQLGLAPREAFQIVKYANNQWKVRKAPGALRVDPEIVDVSEKEGPQNNAAQIDTTEIQTGPQPTTLRKPAGIEQYAITPATQLEHALKVALQAASNAEKYAQQIGYTCRFTPEAIKSMAITLLINQSNGRAA